ncbi:TraR/DksA family transcriptional regulator [Candidatus Parcubacteria bacterium]|nr:TraR/DksA family transcriptional regulator [Candidatus Parcubacteria bacterium]
MTNKDVLSKSDIKTIKAELLARKKQILKDLEDISGDDKNGKVKFPEYGDKSDENAQEISEFSTNLATDKVLQGTLKDIDAAIQRIEDKTYGVCKYCKQPIGKKRMLARPVASACVPCKTKLQSRP